MSEESTAQDVQETTESTDVVQETSSDNATELARLQKEIADLRKENAKHRTANREAERKLAEESGQFKTLYEQSQTELEQLKSQIAQRDRAALLVKVAKAAGLPEDLTDRLKGETEAELLTDAKAMAKRLATPAPSTGATSPGRGTETQRTSKRIGIGG